MTIKDILKKNFIQYRLRDQMKEYNFLKDVDLQQDRLYQIKRKKKNPSISFIIPGLTMGLGGHTSILRLGTYLVESGHDVSYISYKPQKKDEMISNAKENLKGFKGTIMGPEKLNNLKADIGIATFWISAYYLQKTTGVFYKAYFIQDYEPDFYPAGDIRTYAENTYRMGYHMISLGDWNKKQIEKEIGAHADAIVFPYEPDEYGNNIKSVKNLNKKKIIKICAYLKSAAKRGKYLMLMGLEKLYKEAEIHGFDIQISFFGENRGIKYPISVPHRSLGKLSKKELKDLYTKSDFGIVFSYTNISLVPLEMMACGCPVVEVSEGTFKNFFNFDCAILVDSYPQSFVREIMYYIEHPEKKEEIAQKAIESVKGKTWKDAAKQFRQILLRGYSNFNNF